MVAVATYDSQKNKIVVTGSSAELVMVSRIPGAKVTAKGQAETVYTLPPTLDSCYALKSLKVPFSEELCSFGNRQARIQKYIESVKLQKDIVEPLLPVPVKAPYKLYQHQVKAYNIALALFGRGARKEGNNE